MISFLLVEELKKIEKSELPIMQNNTISTIITLFLLFLKKSYIFLTHFHHNSNELKKSPNLITIKTMKITQINKNLGFIEKFL